MKTLSERLQGGAAVANRLQSHYAVLAAKQVRLKLFYDSGLQVPVYFRGLLFLAAPVR